ncbi:MAG: hypothetical protein E7496_00045 [Ruminococcus sp.]|nr:hypothetical protein [Ruminococcus sp.]
MKNILKKSISCCLLFCCVLLCCQACGTEIESPDTIEDILNPKRKEQETETETRSGWYDAETESETEYQGFFFQPETVVLTEAPETIPLTETLSVPTEAETQPITTEAPTELVTEEVEIPPEEWENAYRAFLENQGFQRQISADVQEADTRFLLLYLNDDDIPELFIQTTMEVLIYAYHNQNVLYVDSFYPSHYTYNFYYRPYHNCLGSLQGSVMADGTYLEIYEFENSRTAPSGLVLKETYCYPTRDYSYEIYAERGMNIDLDKAPELDIHPDRQNNTGSSWLTVPDVLENSTSVQRYEITEEGLNAVFGVQDADEQEETSETQERRYAFG